MKYSEFIKETYNDDDDEFSPNELKKRKMEKEKKNKEFNVGDIIVLSDTKKSSKMPEDAYDFLMTYKTFNVKKVNETGKLDLGCNISKNTLEGGVEKTYMFSPNRFELKEPAKSIDDVINPIDIE